MGSWGVGLYSNDIASDLKASFQELVRLPVSPDELIDKLLDDFPAGIDPQDEDHSSFWLVLADLLHAYGLGHPATQATALEIIGSGADLEMNRALEMSEADLRKRARLLDKLGGKWRAPNSKPRARRILTAPEPLIFAVGDCVIYPTQGGNAANARLPAAELAKNFAPDGWGAFAVFASAQRHGYFACHLVARLFLKAAGKASLADCGRAVISGIHPGLPGLPADPAVKVVAATRAEAKKLACETIGSFDWDRNALETAFPDAYRSLDRPSWSLTGLLRPYGDGLMCVMERPLRLKKLPLSRFIRP